MGFCGYAFAIVTPPISKIEAVAEFVGGGVLFYMGNVTDGSEGNRFLGFLIEGGKLGEPRLARWFVILEFSTIPSVNGDQTVLLPYWLLLIAFGAAPATHIWGRIKEKRDKKLFEQAVASKRAEIQRTEIRNQESDSPSNNP